MSDLILRNVSAVVIDPPSVRRCDIRIRTGTIRDVSRRLTPLREEEVLDLSGAIVMPGLVCSHTHLYSALARGMPGPKTSPENFLEILKKVWWKLDEALDEEAIYYSALVGAIESVKLGTTTLVDHHASPNCIPGSLDLIKKAMSYVGMRGILCYETTDRGGIKRRNLGLRENEQFISANKKSDCFRGAVGAHASFTLVDDSMRRLGELAKHYNTGVHIHAGEDRADVRGAERAYRTGLVTRLAKFGLVREKSILAHGVHLTKPELAGVDKAGAWIIHNPRSNMNNAVGHAPLQWFGKRSALGTDGFPADMFEEARFGFMRNAETNQDSPFSKLPAMMQGGQRLVSEYFGQQVGAFAKRSSADLIVLDYDPPTPLDRGNLQAHVLFGMHASMVRHVMIGGRWVVWNRKPVNVDEEEIREKARRVATKLWKKMAH